MDATMTGTRGSARQAQNSAMIQPMNVQPRKKLNRKIAAKLGDAAQ